jgi:hypothetical protein
MLTSDRACGSKTHNRAQHDEAKDGKGKARP